MFKKCWNVTSGNTVKGQHCEIYFSFLELIKHVSTNVNQATLLHNINDNVLIH